MPPRRHRSRKLHPAYGKTHRLKIPVRGCRHVSMCCRCFNVLSSLPTMSCTLLSAASSFKHIHKHCNSNNGAIAHRAMVNVPPTHSGSARPIPTLEENGPNGMKMPSESRRGLDLAKRKLTTTQCHRTKTLQLTCNMGIHGLTSHTSERQSVQAALLCSGLWARRDLRKLELSQPNSS